eukprot:1161885-Pelagomonas_calceolata.AAC.5
MYETSQPFIPVHSHTLSTCAQHEDGIPRVACPNIFTDTSAHLSAPCQSHPWAWLPCSSSNPPSTSKQYLGASLTCLPLASHTHGHRAHVHHRVPHRPDGTHEHRVAIQLALASLIIIRGRPTSALLP